MSDGPARRRVARFTSLCDYCEATIDAGDTVGRVDEGRYVCLRCTRAELRRHTGPINTERH